MVIPYHVTGSWVHVIDDGIVDEDSLPDEALPSGSVTFVPLGPAIAVAGNPATAYTVSETKGIVIEGVLHDLQGREGVWLPGEIGGQPVRWQATTTLQWRGQPVPFPVLEFDLTEDARLTGVLANTVPGQPPLVIDPRIEGLVQEAWEALGQAQAAIDGLEASEANAVAAAKSAAQSRDDAAAAAGSAGSSATAAHDSATAAAGSASAAAGSATSAGEIRDQTVTAAQTVTDNLDAIEAAPGHATAAATARQGAEDARDLAEGHATDAAGSAATASGAASDAQSAAATSISSAALAEGHATDAGGSASDAAGSATDAAGSASAASGHADAAAGSAAEASGSASTASTKADAAAGSATDASDALAQVLVELANTQAYQDVLTAIGDMSADWQADIAAAIADLVGQAPETLDTIEEVATALGNDPNFFTTIMDAIGQKVSNNDPRLSDAREPTVHDHTILQVLGLQAALDGKSDVGHGHAWGQITDKPGTFPSTIALVAGLQAALDGKAASSHTHTKGEVGLGNVDNTSDAAKPVSTATQAALDVKADTQHVDARPAMWLWDGIGSWSPPAAANSGDSVLNLDTNEIHSITEV